MVTTTADCVVERATGVSVVASCKSTRTNSRGCGTRRGRSSPRAGGGCVRECRHLRARRVLCENDGQPLTEKVVGDHVRRAARRARLAHEGVHVLRHTFCSHLAMRGAPARAIQELAGHQELGTTQRYMHLSPAALDAAIRLLDSPGIPSTRGDILETAVSQGGNARS